MNDDLDEIQLIQKDITKSKRRIKYWRRRKRNQMMRKQRLTGNLEVSSVE